MRFPLDMTARMGAYIAKNKVLPNPAWQRDPDPSRQTPFPILHAGRSGERLETGQGQ